MNISYDNVHKTEVILKYLIPTLGCLIDVEGHKITDLVDRCRLHLVRKYEILESAGPRDEGFLWFPINSMSHYYFYNPEKGSKTGTRIWKKRDFIFDDASLLEGAARRDVLEILEDDEVLSISYTDLDYLMAKYEDINLAIHKLSTKHSGYFQQRSFLMSLPTLQRVKLFIEQNRSFTFCATQEIQAIHINLTRVGYLNQLKKIKESAAKEVGGTIS